MTMREKIKIMETIVCKNSFHDFRLCIFFNLESGILEFVSR